MNTAEPPKMSRPRKHRTHEESEALKKKVVASIEREEPMKNFAANAGCSETYAYQVAKNLGYSQMLVSAAERQVVRVSRGTTKLFRRSAA